MNTTILFKDRTTNGDSIETSNLYKPIPVTYKGTFDGCTVTLESNDGADDVWVPIEDTAKTKPSCFRIFPEGLKIRAVISEVGASTSLSVILGVNS